MPLLDALMRAGRALECNDCEDRKQQLGYYCEFCPLRNGERPMARETFMEEPRLIREPERAPLRREKDDPIVLL